jgi:hypothetical protein
MDPERIMAWTLLISPLISITRPAVMGKLAAAPSTTGAATDIGR